MSKAWNNSNWKQFILIKLLSSDILTKRGPFTIESTVLWIRGYPVKRALLAMRKADRALLPGYPRILGVHRQANRVCSIAAFLPPFHSVCSVHSDVSDLCVIGTFAAGNQRQTTSGCHTGRRHILLSPGLPSKKTSIYSCRWAGVKDWCKCLLMNT